jgi:hypothetical protein
MTVTDVYHLFRQGFQDYHHFHAAMCVITHIVAAMVLFVSDSYKMVQ